MLKSSSQPTDRHNENSEANCLPTDLNCESLCDVLKASREKAHKKRLAGFLQAINKLLYRSHPLQTAFEAKLVLKSPNTLDRYLKFSELPYRN